MIEEKDIKAIGKFQKTHALKGELNALLDIDPEYVSEGNALIVEVDGCYVPFYASSIRPKGSFSFLIKLDGIDSEAEAKPFVNKIVYALKNDLADFLDLDSEEIRDEEDLSGYKIIDNGTKEEIGEIKSVDSSTDNLLFIVVSNSGEEVFIPAVDDFIVEINDDDGTITMDLPEGLIDLNKKS